MSVCMHQKIIFELTLTSELVKISKKTTKTLKIKKIWENQELVIEYFKRYFEIEEFRNLTKPE